jgi:hypothetical protein
MPQDARRYQEKSLVDDSQDHHSPLTQGEGHGQRYDQQTGGAEWQLVGHQPFEIRTM